MTICDRCHQPGQILKIHAGLISNPFSVHSGVIKQNELDLCRKCIEEIDCGRLVDEFKVRLLTKKV